MYSSWRSFVFYLKIFREIGEDLKTETIVGRNNKDIVDIYGNNEIGLFRCWDLIQGR